VSPLPLRGCSWCNFDCYFYCAIDPAPLTPVRAKTQTGPSRLFLLHPSPNIKNRE